ncbi:MAG TPA: PEP-CTERM sorting domain-containing protein [Isosphaeraceae bacterium]|jgi:hypothetical protein|nr:PEP-CTERM sorting domain-containing protein [Isosphaeraceae bacterium]
MCRIRVRTGLLLVLITLALDPTAAWEARADVIVPDLSYSTSGAVSSAGVTGAGVVSFNGVAQNTLHVPSTFNVGSFQVAALPDGNSTTYTDTPITISFLTDKNVPLTIHGVLNGKVTGSNSDLRATFQTIEAGGPVFQTGPATASSPSGLNLDGMTQTLTVSLLSSTLKLASAGVEGRQTVLAAQIQAVGTVPEPATAVLFLVALAGLALRHQRRNNR